MNKPSFDELPNAVGQMIEKLNSIEQLLKSYNPLEPADQPLTVKEAAKFLNISVPTVYDYVHKREIPYSKLRKNLYFSRQELIEWIKKSRRKTQEEVKASAEESLKPLRPRK